VAPPSSLFVHRFPTRSLSNDDDCWFHDECIAILDFRLGFLDSSCKTLVGSYFLPMISGSFRIWDQRSSRCLDCRYRTTGYAVVKTSSRRIVMFLCRCGLDISGLVHCVGVCVARKHCHVCCDLLQGVVGTWICLGWQSVHSTFLKRWV